MNAVGARIRRIEARISSIEGSGEGLASDIDITRARRTGAFS